MSELWKTMVVLIALAVVGCSETGAGGGGPTPDVDATVEARVQAALAAVPTATNVPAPTHTPTATSTPVPTNTPGPTSTPTPDPSLNLEYRAWFKSFVSRETANQKQSLQQIKTNDLSDPGWRSQMEKVAITFIDLHEEASETSAPAPFQAFHQKLVASTGPMVSYGELWLSWLESGQTGVPSAMRSAQIQMYEEQVRLGKEAMSLGLPTIDEMGNVIQGRSTFGDGTWRVGFDIEPGTYRTTGTDSCYWARLSNFTGSNDIIANDNARGPAIVTILRSDAGFTSSRCGTWTKY